MTELPNLEGYRDLLLVGEGGYGLVYEAEQASTGQRVAVKVLKLDQGEDEARREYQISRFERETKLCAELSHPHIVQLLDKGYTREKVPFAVFEYIEGETLKELIVRKGGLTAEETGELMGQVLDALAVAHAKGIVHRDLKPHNIMVQQSGPGMHVKILDYGVGAFTHDFRSNDYQSLTLTQEVMGTPAYSAPEQLRGEPATVKSDLYAWGLVLIECLTGVPVMRGNSVAEVFQQQLNVENVPLPPALAGHSMAKILRRVLHKNARLRTGNAAELYADFKKINFSTLVGQIRELHSNLDPADDDAMTVAQPMAWQDRRSEKRQITVLTIHLNMEVKEGDLDLETMDAIRIDQLNQIKDTAARFGGHIAATVTNNVMVYFGYPTVTGNDARRAGRVALEVMSEVRNRSTLLHARHGLELQVRMALHSGTVLSSRNQLPEGAVPNTAFDLLYRAKLGTILITEDAKKLLDPYLEFERYGEVEVSGYSDNGPLWSVTGERQSEAFSFLRPWSADRKMVGRDEERQVLMGLWKQVEAGSSKAVVLNGQAGIGKSKMVYEIKEGVLAKGFIHREVRSLPEYQNNALFPFLEMLRNHWGIAGMQDKVEISKVLERELTANGTDLEQGLPILCFWLSVPIPEGYALPELTPDIQKQTLFTLLRHSILRIGQGNPLLLVLEDLHWLDPTGIEFVEYLLGQSDGPAFLLLITTRPVFVPDWEYGCLTYLELDSLGESNATTLVEGVLDGKSIEEQAFTYIHERSDGIPLYLEELTRMLVEEEYLLLQDDVYHFATSADIQAIPTTLQDLLNANLERLGLAKESAQVAATIGREFDQELLVRASLRDEASVLHDLDILIKAKIAFPQLKVKGNVYVFRHALIRDAAYEGMVAASRKENHLRIAETLKHAFPEKVNENPFEVARHLARGGKYKEGSDYGLLSIEKQKKQSANREALKVIGMMEDWIGQMEDELSALDYGVKIGGHKQSISIMNEGTGSQHLFEITQKNIELISRIAEVTGKELEPELQEVVLQNYWSNFNYYYVQGDMEMAADLSGKVLEGALKTGNRALHLVIRTMRGQMFYIAGQTEESLVEFDAVIHEWSADKDGEISLKYGIDPGTWAPFMKGYVVGYVDGYEAGVEYFELAVTNATLIGSLVVRAFVEVGYSGYLATHKKKQEAGARIRELREIYPQFFEENFMAVIVKLVESWCNDDPETGEQLRDAIIASGQTLTLSQFEIALVNLHEEMGNYQRALEIVQESIDRQVQQGSRCTLPVYYHALGYLLEKLRGGPSEESKAAINQAIKEAEDMRYTALVNQIRN